MRVVILAAGLSTRLRPLTENTPKPMLLVNGRPMIEYIVEQVVEHGLCDVIITTHFHAEAIRAHFGTGKRFGARIRYAHEEQLMDTAGSLKAIQHELQEDFFVIGGNDFLPKLDINELISCHRVHRGIGTIALKRLNDPILLAGFGQATLDECDRIVSFVEKPQRFTSDLIHTTYQIYAPRILNYVPQGTPCSIPEWMLQKALQAGEPVYGYVTQSPFICISTKEQYERSHQQVAATSRLPLTVNGGSHEVTNRLVHHQDL